MKFLTAIFLVLSFTTSLVAYGKEPKKEAVDQLIYIFGKLATITKANPVIGKCEIKMSEFGNPQSHNYRLNIRINEGARAYTNCNSYFELWCNFKGNVDWVEDNIGLDPADTDIISTASSEIYKGKVVERLSFTRYEGGHYSFGLKAYVDLKGNLVYLDYNTGRLRGTPHGNASILNTSHGSADLINFNSSNYEIIQCLGQ